MRLANLDYLRGIAAFGIMIYHYSSWLFGKFYAETFMGRVGIYGVSIFYILSGLTLFHVYAEKLTPDVSGVGNFFLKRFFRIYPLLWMVMICTIIIQQKIPGFGKLFLNFTGLFGFYSWSNYIGTGVWSIGNELVFYSIFPFVIFALRHSNVWTVIIGVFAIVLYVYFAFYLLDPLQTLTSQWHNYVNPLNQFLLFMSGMLIGYFGKGWKTNNNVLPILLITTGLAVFAFYPVSGDRINLVTGLPRLIFTASCITICTGFFKLSVPMHRYLTAPLTLIGEASYSIYLLHPLVFNAIEAVNERLDIGFNLYILLLCGVAITLIVSYFVYEYFEKFFMRKGKTFIRVAANS